MTLDFGEAVSSVKLLLNTCWFRLWYNNFDYWLL